MPSLVIWGLIISVVILSVIFSQISEKNKIEKFKTRLKDEFGAVKESVYSADRLNSINGYFNYHLDNDSFKLDDLTWNDIEMDRVYRRINYCYSSPGDEILYSKLRCPNTDKKDWSSYEKKLAFWTDNEEERLKVQIIFAKLSRTGRFSLYKYIEFLDGVSKVNLLWFLLLWLGYLALVPIYVVNTPVAVLVTFLYIGFNFLIYFLMKKKIEMYFISFAYILKLLNISKKLASILPKEYEEEAETLRTLRKEVGSISNFYNAFLTSQPSGIDDISALIMSMLKVFFHLDLFGFYRMLGTVKGKTEIIDRIFCLTGEIEADISVASFRKSLEFYTVPDFSGEKGISATDIFHPLIRDAVSNSFTAKKGILITGSNASGKSTFLRTVAINSVLAQCINTVCAKEFKSDYYRIFSSMSIKDSLSNNESYYIAEIKSLKRLINQTKEYPGKVLMFVDEVLRGTNTVDRISAGCEILKALSSGGNMLFAATHDIELTRLLVDYMDNCHFEEEISNDDIIFPYKLFTGEAKSRNAIQLLKLLDFPSELVTYSTERANEFLRSGEWKI